MNSFNPDSRWDRFEPQRCAFDPYALNERIDVLVYFRNGKATPKVFTWNKKDYTVKAVNYNWQERCGQATISYFSVNCADQIYQISFNNATFRWQIDKIIE